MKKKAPKLHTDKKKKAPVVKGLKPQWELFCRFYTQNQKMFGNATHSYAEAYDYKLDTLDTENAQYEELELENGSTRRGKKIIDSDYDRAVAVCATEGGRLLRTPEIQDRLTELLNDLLTDKMIDSQLAKVAMQDKDLSAKMQAIKEYNAVKNRVTKKVELTGANGEPLFNDEHRKKTDTALKDLLG